MNILIIFVLAIIVVFFAFNFYVTAKKQGIREAAIKLIVEAEEIFEYGKNSEKFNYVIQKIDDILPSFAKYIVNKDTIITFVQKIFDEIKIALDYIGDE